MKNQISSLFFDTISQIKSKTLTAELLLPLKSHLNSRMMNKTDLCPHKLVKKYANICKKYEKGAFTENKLGWHQNQKKIFIWFSIVYCVIKNKNYSEITQQQWEMFSQIFFNKNRLLLQFQCHSISKNHERVQWKKRQERMLQSCINRDMIGHWNQISRAIFFESQGSFYKTSKQCREHWFNHMDKNKKKGLWTVSQDLTILKFVQAQGKKWSRIVLLLENKRTEHMTKNRFYSILNYASRIYCPDTHKSENDLINLLINELSSIELDPLVSKLSIFPEAELKNQQICLTNYKIQENSQMNLSQGIDSSLDKPAKQMKITQPVSLRPETQSVEINHSNIIVEEPIPLNYINYEPTVVYNQQMSPFFYQPASFGGLWLNFLTNSSQYSREQAIENQTNRVQCLIQTPLMPYSPENYQYCHIQKYESIQ